MGALVGVPIGCLAALAIVGATMHAGPPVSSIKFGDIAVMATTRGDPNELSSKDELSMSRAGRPFLLVTTNDVGDVNCLSLADGPNRVNFSVSASPDGGRWIRAAYGRTRQCEEYFDIDFDGQFDYKLLWDADGSVSSRSIYFAGEWKPVDRSERGVMFSGSDALVFRRGIGWQRRGIGGSERQGSE
jgi:hypothetical protein